VPRSLSLKSLQRPAVLTGISIGNCLAAWTDEYLASCFGDGKVSVHVSDTKLLNFASKNFKYEVMPFGAFLQRIQRRNGEFLYYRSQHSKRNKPSSLDALGTFGSDFELPPALLHPFEMHSTVLRVASTGLCMWLHYDVCDNFLCCIRGCKRVVLFHPDDVGNLYISGSSSALGSRLLGGNLLRLWEEFPLAEAAWARRWEAVLHAGDVLFIPAFWPHCTEALPHADGASEASVSVNAFVIQRANKSFHDQKDVWANRELLPAQDAVKAMEEKVLPSLTKLPPMARSFYCKKLAAQLNSTAQGSGESGG